MSFTKEFFESSAWQDIRWMGIQIFKNPMDLFIYQEIIFDKKPEYIIECGTGFGGSALYMASVMDAVGVGEIISIDTRAANDKPAHPRVKYMLGSSIAIDVFNRIKEIVGDKSCMVILDSDHTMPHVLEELSLYSTLVTPGQYLIVEDTCMTELGISGDGGPKEALDEFMKNENSFSVDKSREKLLTTFNPGGYLLKK